MKRLVVIILFTIIITSCLTGCDNGLLYTDMKVVKLPEKTVYFADVDTTLSFEGGLVLLICADGTTEEKELQQFTYQSTETKAASGDGPHITSNVNFSEAGEYTVYIYQTSKVWCQYNVTVREQDQSD